MAFGLGNGAPDPLRHPVVGQGVVAKGRGTPRAAEPLSVGPDRSSPGIPSLAKSGASGAKKPP